MHESGRARTKHTTAHSTVLKETDTGSSACMASTPQPLWSWWSRPFSALTGIVSQRLTNVALI